MLDHMPADSRKSQLQVKSLDRSCEALTPKFIKKGQYHIVWSLTYKKTFGGNLMFGTDLFSPLNTVKNT